MINPIERALQASRATEKTLAGVSVTLYRGGSPSAAIVATTAQTEYLEGLGDGSGYAYRSRDYCINVEDYAFSGVRTEPQEGDLVSEIINGTECRFEVLSFDGLEAFSYMDRSRLVYRIHTKEVPSNYDN